MGLGGAPGALIPRPSPPSSPSQAFYYDLDKVSVTFCLQSRKWARAGPCWERDQCCCSHFVPRAILQEGYLGFLPTLQMGEKVQ